MKIIKHRIKGASLQRIEELHHLGTPDWVPATRAVGQMTAVEEAMAETMHFSGLLRGCSRSDFVEDGINLVDEDGSLHDLGELLDDAAERLDQAHEEWLEAQKHAVRHQDPLLDDDEVTELRAILMAYCEDSDSSPAAAKAVDNLWNKIKGAKA